MSLFRKPTPAAVELTDEAFSRWLRARSPQPLAFFLSLSESEQEALALLGDEYTQDLCLGIGFAVHDPLVAQAGLDAAENPASEDNLLLRIAQTAARKAQDARAPSGAPTRGRGPTSMGGFQERTLERVKAKQREADEARSFCGRPPDSIRKAQA